MIEIGTLSKYALLAAILTRAPGQPVLGTVPFLGTSLHAAAGYVLVFSPMAIALAMWWIRFTYRGAAIDASLWTRGDLWFARAAFAFPAIAAAFISLQFFLLFAPKGECPTFDRASYLFDYRRHAFQPEYCIGVSEEAAKNMPYLFDPVILQAWGQIAFPIWTAWSAWWLWQSWRGRTAQAEAP